MKLTLASVMFAILLGGVQAIAQTALPDLIINANRLTNTVQQKYQKFGASSCAYFEGCINGTGKRKPLKFATGIPNIGSADIALGDPADHPELYEYSSCHNHYHLRSATRYELLNAAGTVVMAGRKQAFCFRDSSQYLSSAGPSNGYTCHNQGITKGWQDVYGAYLDCQWIDVTGIPAGNYKLRVTVNPDRVLAESNYSNNTVTINVVLTGK